PDGVDDPARGQVAGGRSYRVARRQPIDERGGPQPTALLKDRRTARAVDGSVNSPAAEQRVIGSVDDRVGGDGSDITLEQLDPDHACHATHKTDRGNMRINRTLRKPPDA